LHNRDHRHVRHAVGCVPWSLDATGFFEWATAQTDKNKDSVGAAAPLPSHDDLKGVGVSIACVAPSGLALKAPLARRLGGIADTAATGTEPDGLRVSNRVVLQQATQGQAMVLLLHINGLPRKPCR
jgi:hypothetical protein